MIQILPAELVHQIAAGQIIDRPAAVVKELIENSLDAQAKTIRIQIKRGGLDQIKVSDDGQGMDKQDLKLALAHHATSKIRSWSDLQNLHSLGFRGEALPSIAAVARLQLSSRPPHQAQGWQIDAEDLSLRPVAMNPGTIVQVNDLFHALPARRKFLKNAAAEKKRVEQMVHRLALAHFQTTFEWHSPQKQRLPANQPEQRIAQLLGADFLEQSRYFEAESFGMRLRGWLSLPPYMAQHHYFYLNHRWIRSAKIHQTIKQAYADIAPRYQPSYLIYLEMEPGAFDINIHPAKHEVRFADAISVQKFIRSSIERALSQKKSRLDWQLSDSAQADYLPQPLGQAVAQIGQYYLLAQNEQGLIVVDIHAAHERILYERLKQQMDTQILSPPFSLKCTEQQMETLLNHRDLLAEYGIELAAAGPQNLWLRRLPTVLLPYQFQNLVPALCAELERQGHSISLQQSIRAQLASAACHQAWRGGRLSLAEMNALLRQIEQTERSDYCNHGRPTWMPLISFQSLNKRFMRGA